MVYYSNAHGIMSLLTLLLPPLQPTACRWRAKLISKLDGDSLVIKVREKQVSTSLCLLLKQMWRRREEVKRVVRGRILSSESRKKFGGEFNLRVRSCATSGLSWSYIKKLLQERRGRELNQLLAATSTTTLTRPRFR